MRDLLFQVLRSDMLYAGLKYETGQTAKAHETVANNLDAMVLRPFATWASSHETRITDLRDQLTEAVKDWESLSDEVSSTPTLQA